MVNIQNKKMTISVVAELAGVSNATVSRYLNGHFDKINDDTISRIRKVIDVTGYKPNSIARNLKRTTTDIVGVVVSDISSPFSSALILGCSEYLEKKGYTPLIVNTNDSIENEKALIDSLIAKGVSGILVNTSSYNNDTLIKLALEGMPVVLCDRRVKDYKFNLVTSENEEGIRQLVEHLHENGYTKVGFFTQPWKNNSARMIRVNAFKSSMEKIYNVKDSTEIYIDTKDDSLKDLKFSVKKFLDSMETDDKPAVIGVNSITTIRVLKVLKRLGMKIPNDIGVCGPEDWGWKHEMNWPDLITPSVTTIVMDPVEMGEQAAKLLVKQLEEKENEKKEICIPFELCVRQSTIMNV